MRGDDAGHAWGHEVLDVGGDITEGDDADLRAGVLQDERHIRAAAVATELCGGDGCNRAAHLPVIRPGC